MAILPLLTSSVNATLPDWVVYTILGVLGSFLLWTIYLIVELIRNW